MFCFVMRNRTLDPLHLVVIACLLLCITPANAQFGSDNDDENDITSVLGTSAIIQPKPVIRAPVFDPICVIQPNVDPVMPDPFDPVVTRKAKKDDCDFEPEVAAAFRASKLAEEDKCPTYLGRLSANRYEEDSTANTYSAAGSPYSSTSINNRYGPYGSPYSSTSGRNPYATDAPKIIAQDGTYLGKLSDNPYDPDSVSNPFGRYGSPYSPTSIKNPYSTYGSPYSPPKSEQPVCHAGTAAFRGLNSLCAAFLSATYKCAIFGGLYAYPPQNVYEMLFSIHFSATC